MFSCTLRLPRTWTGGLWVLREAGPRKLRAVGVLFWSLIPGEQVTLGHMARKQSPCSRAPAPEGCSSSRVKTGRTGSLLQLPGLEPPASIFFLSASNEAAHGIVQVGKRVEAARGPVMPQPRWVIRRAVLGQ